ncbi:MAG TPA: universal stress protein [Cyclobacteriaceae bacterium]|nr:universal stress protein [Cyclobacteriaceae bacterium]HMV08439.1 universal stress protein [Cyclobacteriaceae bacterium]HMV91174.1 universal stress protein [Cyclobacteriaceae bacterium]HMX01212.1 universal stress protein [Cyclobacteriaceae bacterium]HMX50615.1 universal stress protein [Cyclobacteriaceae bacterium]
MKRILCPTDFSPAADNAIAFAAKLAQTTGSTLTLLHIGSIFDILDVNFKPSLTLIRDELELQSLQVSRTFKISCDSDMRISYQQLGHAIKECEPDYDLVVIGTSGPDDLLALISGGHAYPIIRASTLPVLLIPEGSAYQGFQKITFAFDYWRKLILPVEPLLWLVRKYQSELTVLQVMEESVSDEAEAELRQLQHKFNADENRHLHFHTTHARKVPEAIDHYIQHNHPDLLALCITHDGWLTRLFHRSAIKHLTAVSKFPLYIFPIENYGPG